MLEQHQNAIPNIQLPMTTPTFAKKLAARVISVCWWIAIGGFAATIAWMMFDSYAEFTILSFLHWGVPESLEQKPDNFRFQYNVLTIRDCCLVGLGIAYLIALAIVLVGLLIGNSRQRSVRSILILTALFAGWLVILQNATKVIDLGRSIRIASMLKGLERFVEQVQAEVDTAQSDKTKSDTNPEIDVPHQTYSHDGTFILMFVGNYSIPNTHFTVSAIEYTPGQAVRLELGGGESGRWAEYRIDGLKPYSFEGGLGSYYRLQNAWTISKNWYLVEYGQFNGDIE